MPTFAQQADTLKANRKAKTEADKPEKKTIIFDENAPMINSEAEPRLYYIRNVNIHGVEYLKPDILRSSAGLIPGDSLYLPSSYISSAANRLWSQRYFSDVKIGATIEGDSLDLEVFLQERPRVHHWDVIGPGMTRSKSKELIEEQLKLQTGTELSDYVIDKNEKLLKKYYSDKGFRNAKITTSITNDTLMKNAVNVTFRVDRNAKVRVGSITFEGNDQFTDKRLRKAFKKTHQKSANFFQNTKLKEADYKEDKNLLLDFYNARGYRNATILSDSIYNMEEDRIGIHIKVDEGNKFYIRDVKWVGNSIFATEDLQRLFSVKKGDTYDKKSMHKKLGIGREMDPDQESVSTLYQNRGYLMSQIEPSEIVVGADSIDMEIKVFEGKPFTINEVGISGNTKVDDEVIRRELSVYPGQLYDRSQLMYTIRQLMNMGHFDPEQMEPDIQPISSDLVNINFPLVEAASDQFNIAGGWGAGSFVGSVGISLKNVSTRNLFKKGKWTPYPMGQNQRF